MTEHLDLARLPLAEDGASISDFLGFWLSAQVLAPEQQRVFDSYYDSYKQHFGPYIAHWYARQTRELIALIKRLDHPRVLEVGCGCGTEALWTALNGGCVKGIDISPDRLAVARARKDWLERQTGRALDCTFERGSVLDEDESRPFAIVFCEQAFHHLEPRADVVAKLARLVAPGGYLILSEANGWNPFLQIKLFKVRGRQTIIFHEGHPWGHERVTVPVALLKLFRAYQLRRESLGYYRAFPNIEMADRLLLMDRWLPTFMKPVFTHFNLVLRKTTPARSPSA